MGSTIRRSTANDSDGYLLAIENRRLEIARGAPPAAPLAVLCVVERVETPGDILDHERLKRRLARTVEVGERGLPLMVAGLQFQHFPGN
jgi:hypothetical protein